MLFAADEPSTPWWWLPVTAAAAVFGKWAWDKFMEWVNGKRQYEREIKREAMDDLYKLNDRLQEDFAKSDARVDELTEKCQRMEVKYERAVAWIEYVSDHLARLNPPVYVRPFKTPDDTGKHRPLEQQPEGSRG